MCPRIRPQKSALENEVKTSGKKGSDNNYNVKQSKIAIGSGGLIGKGLLKGTQTRYDFVPEQKTDFIFLHDRRRLWVYGQHYLPRHLCPFTDAYRLHRRTTAQRIQPVRMPMASPACFFFHITINVCMTIGLAPVIGIPLPFVSYGGTSLLTFSIMLFILVRLDADRQMVLR
jgi:rod shape determining protein RodA